MIKLIFAVAYAALASARPVNFPFESTVVVKGTQTTSEFAVKELNAIVRKATGREFEVRTSGNLADCSRKKKIFVGRSPELDKLLVRLRIDETFGEEESVVMHKNGNLRLFGKDELGSLWAVYDFCEDSLGYRWYLNRKEDDGGETVAKTDIVRWNGVSTRRQPKFLGTRRMHGGVRSETGSWLFRVRNRDNSAVHEVCPAYRWKYQVWTRGHGFNMYLPSGKITPNIEWCIPKGAKIKPDNFKEHPEWFSLMKDGKRSGDHQLCLSNPGCRKALIEAVSEYVRVCGKGVYMVGENDCRFGRYCHCDGCIALEKKYNTTGGPMWDFIIEACNAVKARFGEGVYLTALAYNGMNQTEKAPDNIAFPDNFIVDIAYIHCPDRAIKQLPDKRAPEGEMVNYWQNTLKWCRLVEQRSYWFYGTMNPCLVYRRMVDEIRELHEAEIQSPGACCTGGGYEFCDFTPYLYYKLLQDPYCDIRTHLKEVLRFKYGKAAPLMLKYIDSLENTFIEYRKGCGGRVFETDRPYENLGFIAGSQIAQWRSIFDEAEPLVKDSPVHAANLNQAKIGLNIMTVLFEKRLRRDAPNCAFDRAAVLAEARNAAEDYGKRYIYRRTNYALQILEQVENEMTYYGDLKTDKLPPEFDGMQPQFITRILPYKSVLVQSDRFGRMTSEPEPQAICGYAVVDRRFDDRDVSNGIPVYVWDFGAAVQHKLKTIPLSAFKKDKYSLVNLGTTELSSDCSLIFAEGWSSTLAQKFLPRVFNPSNPKRKYEIWASLKAEGPKFFQGDTRENRLYLEQLFVVEIVGN